MYITYLIALNFVKNVKMCLYNLRIVWGNYLIIEVAGIPLHIKEHLEHFKYNIC